MHIPIRIPIGVKYIASVQGAVWKVVDCAQCQERYAYRVELEVIGEDIDLLFLDGTGSAERARAQAEGNLVKASRNALLPIPCPHCGFYQDDMSRTLKDAASINSLQIAGAAIAVLSLVPLAFGFRFNWILTVILAAAGLTVLGYGYVVAFRFDPNIGDPEQRKALGRRHAVWGEQLAELTTSASSGSQTDAPSGT